MKVHLCRHITWLLSIFVAFAWAAQSSELLEGEIETNIVPSPVHYNILLPDDHATAAEPFPLALFLHGGTGDRSQLVMLRPLVDELWADGSLAKMVIVTPTVTQRCFYMDFKDASEKWETFIIGPFLECLRQKYNVANDPKKTFISGISMGGEGALRMAFKYPDRFGAVVAMEPGIMPALTLKGIRPKHRFYRGKDVLERAFGTPVDESYWEANNAASIAVANADKIRSSGLEIYLECGDEDAFWLYEGAEFLHQVLWEKKIRHEYHLVRGADHLGPSLAPRLTEGFKFLGRVLDPWERVNAQTVPLLRELDLLKKELDEKDHYSTE